MGAMAPPPHWIPEDDVLLKNAVEAGASLESLAKGAVQFSRRFTVQELQYRWSSLLYDPVVSIEASAQMIEVERSGFTNQSRPNKLEVAKETACSLGKRKAESIRKCYYAMRKRICNEPYCMMGVDLFSGPGYSNFGEGNEFLSVDCRIGNPISSNLGIQGPDFDIKHHCFSEFGQQAAESTGHGVTSSFSDVQNHGQDLHLGGEDVSHNLSCPYEGNISLTGDCSEVPGFDQSKELPLCNMFEAEGLVNEGSPSPEFGGPPFSSFGYSSSLPQMPIWCTSQEVSAAGLPIHIGEKDQQTRDAFMIPQINNAKESEALGYGVGGSNSKLETPLSSDGIMDITSRTEEYIAELSDTLFNLANDNELLFMDTDGKDAIEKSYLDGLSSLLLDSPNQPEFPGAAISEAAAGADGHLIDTSSAQNEGLDDKGLDLCYHHKVPDAQVAPSASTTKGFGPEYRNGVICCVLNTEDPEIPSNDDVFLPFRFPSPTSSSEAHWRMDDPSYLVSSSVKDFSSTQNANGGPLTNQKDSYVPSRKIGSSEPLDMGLRYPIGDHGVKFELPKSNIQHAALRNARNSECPNRVSLENANANNFIAGVVKGGAMEMEQGKSIDYKSLGPCPDKHGIGLDILQSLQENASGSMTGLDAKVEFPNNASSNADLSFQQTIVPEPIESLLSDKEELWSENEFDVPYFSDVEAMILDMDLSPDEFDLYTNLEVKRYQQEETKRTIIRLEQAADAFTQRTIAGQGAFAVLYGRCSKYFIKKPQVLLGRATNDIKVDIDLGRERNGGKISRKQAIMKMDMHGVFHLKNLGKSSIYVNGKEVAPGQSLSLTSGCLIEARGLTFVFETNHKIIKQYVDSIAGGPLVDHNRS